MIKIKGLCEYIWVWYQREKPKEVTEVVTVISSNEWKN